MYAQELLDRAAPAAAPPAPPCLAEVVSVEDPEGLSRVQVRLLHADGVGEQDAPLWARVAVPFAGADRGAFFLPDVGDEVLVVLVQGDPRLAVIVGGLWNGGAKAPEQLGGDRVDRWTLTGKAGTRIAIVEESPGEATISFTTPNGVRGELTDSGGGRVELEAAGSRVTLEGGGVTIETGGKVDVQASQVNVKAGTVKVDAAVSTFSGVVKCDVLQAPTVLGNTYSPGAGNVW